MLTHQDLLSTPESGKTSFVRRVIDDYRSSEMYKMAAEADAYARHMNTAITEYRKILYSMSGEAVPDNFSANHKCASNFFDRFITQETQFLLGNGVMFEDAKTPEKLGSDFDTQLQKAGYAALWGAIAYGFYNLDHVEVFTALEFAPLWDEEDGALKAGVRFWRIAPDKPLRATLFEMDGYTDYILRTKGMAVLKEKRAYRQIVRTSTADGTEIYDGENYPGFPVVPLWGNNKHQSELVGLKQQIDCYDLIKSGFANDLDDASMIYWTLENCGGMDDIDLAKFIERMKVVKAAVVDGGEGAKATAHTLEVPYQSRESYLARLESDLYKDAMALDTAKIAAGNVTATAIRAAYEPLNNKTDAFEYCVIEFIDGLLAVAGIEDTPRFKRSMISNQQEETQMVLMAAQYLDTETVLKHLPFLLPDEIEAVLDRLVEEEADRYEQSAPDDTHGDVDTVE